MSGAPAVLRFSRDRRGYEHFYLVQPERHGRGPARILYWFRSPPGIKVGRAPFDDELKQRIEAQNPGVTFDWPRLVATPFPPPAPEPERWRERRQTERAEKAARAARQADLGPLSGTEAVEPELEDGASEGGLVEEPVAQEGGRVSIQEEGTRAAEETRTPEETRPADGTRPPEHHGRRRRRRRRGGGGRGASATSAVEHAPPPPKPEASNE